MASCWERIAALQHSNKSRLCVGLDVDPDKYPDELKGRPECTLEFNKGIIDSTIEHVCAYKPNAAFYEAMGESGLLALKETIRYIGGRVPVVLDVKRGDIGNTAAKYAAAAYEDLEADAVTLSPYMGFDSIEPFMKYEGRGIFLLCLTSNASSADFQLEPEENPFFARVARKAAQWDSGRGQLGLVVGATHPGTVGKVREMAAELPFLLPGIGAQGGAMESVNAAETTGSGLGVVVNASRGVIYAGSGSNWREEVTDAASELKVSIGT